MKESTMNYKKLLSSAVVSGLLISQSFAMTNNKVYVTVNGESIKASDIAVALKDPRINFDELPKENQKRVLDQLIEKKLLSQEAVNSDVINDPIYKKTLQETIETLKQDLALQIWIQKTSKTISVSDKEIETFYNQNRSKMVQQEQYKANHILVKTQEEAKQIIAQLQKSKNLKDDFVQLAKEKSTGPSGKNGGDLGWFEPKQMVPEFSMATSFLKKGEITKSPVKTQFGYHVIYLDDKKESKNVSLEEVKDDIKNMLMQEKFNQKLEALINEKKQKAKIIYK